MKREKLVEKTQSVLDRALALRSEGRRMNDILSAMNEEGYRKPRGGRLDYNSLYLMMHKHDRRKPVDSKPVCGDQAKNESTSIRATVQVPRPEVSVDSLEKVTEIIGSNLSVDLKLELVRQQLLI